MDTIQLSNRLKTIFDKEEYDLRNNNFSLDFTLTRPRLSPEEAKNAPPQWKAYVKPSSEYKIIRPPLPEIEYKNLDNLIKLYTLVSSNNTLKSHFLNWITHHIEKHTTMLSSDTVCSINRSTAGLAFLFLFRINELDLARNATHLRFRKKIGSIDIYRAIKHIITYEHFKLNENSIKILEEITYELNQLQQKLEPVTAAKTIQLNNADTVRYAKLLSKPRILDILHKANGTKNSTQLAKELKMARSNLSTYLNTLKKEDLIEIDEEGRVHRKINAIKANFEVGI